ncbi:MAG: aldehyde ferredoxin oxidoreductase family protein [Candidatus Asgardarchaeia archaeon]
MYKGYNGKILRINLTDKKIKTEPLSNELVENFVGGMGFGVKILFDEIDPKIDPLSDENKLIFSIGPLTARAAPFAQTCLVTKSPLTNTILNTYAGGYLGYHFKRSNYDVIIFEGKAEEPVYVEIIEDDVDIISAKDIWGKGTHEAQKILKKKYEGKLIETAVIGPAGEHLVRMAAVVTEERTFGRGGAGAVMGSKNLKGFVIGGKELPEIYDMDAFKGYVKEANEILKKEIANQYSLIGAFSKIGTMYGIDLLTDMGMMATKNHYTGVWDGIKEVNATTYLKNFHVRHGACFGCPIHCWKINKIKTGKYAGIEHDGPEYESIYALGTECEIKNPEAIMVADYLCDDYGIDTLSVGNTIAYTMEAYEKGYITKEDLNGLDLKFGNWEAQLELLRKIAYRDGIGDILAEGIKHAVEKFGNETSHFAMHVKGLNFAAWMPRAMKGMALAFGTANRGACHKRAIIGDEVMGRIDPQATKGKGPKIRDIQDRVNAVFTLVGCRFSEFAYSNELYVNLLNSVTGLKYTPEGFMKLGARIWNLERIFNVVVGFRRKDDWLPGRCFEPLPEGPTKGYKLTPEEYNAMLDEYYESRKWTKEGIPTKEILSELGIEYAYEKIKDIQ